MTRAVLFDMDGVLCDARPWHRAALDAALAEHGYQPVGDLTGELEGLPTRVKLERLAAAGRFREVDASSVIALKQRYTWATVERQSKFDPGTFCLVIGLRAAGYRVGVVTNSTRDTAMMVLDRLGLSPHLDVLVTNETGPPKPDPFPYLRATDILGLPPDDCLAIEDGDYGVRSAEDAGCRVMRVDGPAGVTPAAVWANLGT